MTHITPKVLIFSLLVGLISLAGNSHASSNEFRCDILSSNICTNGDCEEANYQDQYLLIGKISEMRNQSIKAKSQFSDSSYPTIRRCDSKGCNRIVVSVYRGGIITTLKGIETSGYFLKFINIDLLEAKDKGKFTEVSSYVLSAIVKTGNCPEVFD